MKRRRFQTAELMHHAIEKYKDEFEKAEGTIMPSMAGLALALGFQSTSALRNYEGYADQDFKWVIDNARLWIEAYLAKYGKTAFDKAHVSSINPEWRDRSELELKGDALKLPDLGIIKAQMAAAAQARLKEREEKVIEAYEEDDESWAT